MLGLPSWVALRGIAWLIYPAFPPNALEFHLDLIKVSLREACPPGDCLAYWVLSILVLYICAGLRPIALRGYFLLILMCCGELPSGGSSWP